MARPFYGVNVVDVRHEHYDAVLENIKGQGQGAELLLGGRLHMFSATDYGEIRRVIFTIYYESFPDTATFLENLRGIGNAHTRWRNRGPRHLDRDRGLDGIHRARGGLQLVGHTGARRKRAAVRPMTRQGVNAD